MCRARNLFSGVVLFSLAVLFLMAERAAHAESVQFFGVVTTINTDKSHFMISDPRSGKRVLVSVTEETTFLENGKEKTVEDIEVGRPVIVDFEESGNENIAYQFIFQSTTDGE